VIEYEFLKGICVGEYYGRTVYACPECSQCSKGDWHATFFLTKEDLMAHMSTHIASRGKKLII